MSLSKKSLYEKLGRLDWLSPSSSEAVQCCLPARAESVRRSQTTSELAHSLVPRFTTSCHCIIYVALHVRILMPESSVHANIYLVATLHARNVV